MQDFRKLTVWSKAHALTIEIYRITRDFPSEERYGLTTQLRRAAASVPTNLAEGCGRHGAKELARFVAIASGSASEVDYLLTLARDVEVLTVDDFDKLEPRIAEIKRMLGGFHRRLITED